MSSINYVTFSGTVARNSIHQGVSPSGKAWASFRLASTSSSYDKNTGTYTKEPTFYCNCVAFGKLATMAESVLQDGVSLLVSGHFSTKGYEKKDGTAGSDAQVTCENIAVICVPWQTISVSVNNNDNSASASSNPAPVTSQQQQSVGSSNAWASYPTTSTQPVNTSNAWNNIPMTATQPYSGAAALGVSDNPGF